MADAFCRTCAHGGKCTGAQRAGRECLASLNASRAALWMPPLPGLPEPTSTRWPAITGGALGFLFACAAAAACLGVQLLPF